MTRRHLLAALLLVLLAIPALRTQALNEQLWIDDLSTGSREFLAGTGTITLSTDALPAPEYMGAFGRSGSYLSPEHTFSAPVEAVTLDADVTLPEGSSIRLDVRGRNAQGNWQLWHEAPRGVRVVLDQPTATVQYRMTLLSNAESPHLRSVSVMADWSTGNYAYDAQRVAPTYRIHATREGLVGRRTANGYIIKPRDHFVALPSWRSLSSYKGYEYQVRLSYKGRSVVVPVWDVGPWNTHDDYWSTNRQMWKDLPRGMPQAQAAYQQGYNGGRDEFGRRPNLPNGIDIADGTFWDSLGMKGWDWVDVTFLWEGVDPGGAAPAPPEPTATPVPVAQPPQDAILVDNTNGGFSEVRGTWFDGRCGVNNTHRWTYSVPSEVGAENLGTWKAPITKAGFYEVYAYIPACGKPATRSARYDITHEGNMTSVVLDQEGHQNAWNSLGTFYFKPDQNQGVSLSDITADHGLSVRYDSLAFVLRSDTEAPSASIIDVRSLGAGRYEVIWNGNDDASGIASFDVQVQRDGGTWSDWMPYTNLISSVYLVNDTKPSLYGFRVRARDWAGNLSEYAAEPQMTILLEPAPPPTEVPPPPTEAPPIEAPPPAYPAPPVVEPTPSN